MAVEIGHQRPAEADIGVRGPRNEKSGAFGDADQGPCRVEDFDQDHDEHDVNDPSVQGSGKIELQERRGDRRRRRGNAAERTDARQNGGDRDEKNSDQNRAWNSERVETRDREEAENAQKHARRRHVAERHVGGRVRDDKSRALHRDERQEESDARRDRAAHGMRDACDEPPPDSGERQDQEDHARDEDGAERLLPAIAELPDDRECKEGVEPHARRHGDRPVGPEAHDGRTDRRGKAGRDEDGVAVHPRAGKNLRIDEDDVSHRDEGRDAGNDFRSNVRLQFSQLEEAAEHVRPPWAFAVRQIFD